MIADPRIERVERLFDGPDWSSEPGCAAVIVERGEIVWQGTYGLAHVAARTPIAATTRFRIASITKPMVAMVVASLIEDGALSLDDPIQRHIPEAAAPEATLGQLLAMKSGILELYPLAWLAFGTTIGQIYDTRDALALLLTQREVNHAPGERTIYANAGYLLAQLAIERITGQPLGAMLHARVFDPAGMAESVLAPGVAHQLREVALAYVAGREGFDPADPHLVDLASGGVVSTIGDMACFYTWLRGDPYRWRSQLATPLHHNDGTPSNYAHGFQVQRTGGVGTIGHSGGIAGWACDSLWAPEPDVAVIVLGNRNDQNWYERAREMLLSWLDLPGDPGATPRLIAPAAPKPSWTEDYGCDAAGWSVRLQGAGNELIQEGRRLPRDADGLFRRTLGVEPTVFEVGGDLVAPPPSVVRREGNVVMTLRRAEICSLKLEALTGVYARDDLPGAVTITMGADGLLRIRAGSPWPVGDIWTLRPIVGSMFRAFQANDAPTEVHVRFETAGGAIPATAIRLTLTRILDLRLVRLGDAPADDWAARVADRPAMLAWRAE